MTEVLKDLLEELQSRKAPTRPPRDWIQILVTALPGLAAAIALIFTWQSINATTNATNRQLQITEQGQVTDRYNAAITNLGSRSIDVRLGGIYALQRIMQDSPRDQLTIIAVLCAFARDQATPATVKSGQVTSPAPNGLPTDIQAALTVMGTRDTAYDNSTSVIDLAGVDLAGANFTGTNFTGANFISANLSGTDLSGANFTGANLYKANLSFASIANFTGPPFSVNLTGANLYDANLTGATLGDANLSGATLIDAHLPGAELSGANFTGANLSGADFSVADLVKAHLFHADLYAANLPSAYLTGADLTGADLTAADLAGAYLDDANLSHANLSHANLTKTKLNGAKGISTGGGSP